MAEFPILLSLGPNELHIRNDSLLTGLSDRALSVMPRDKGLTMKFAGSRLILRAIADMIDVERRCCPFLNFRVEVEARYDEVWLDISGPVGSRELLYGLIAAGRNPPPKPARRKPRPKK